MKLLIALTSLFSASVYACSCAQWGTARELLSEYNVAYVGTLVGSRDGGISPDGDPVRLNSFNVIKAFKPRTLRKKFSVRSQQGDGANCGTMFTRSTPYLIFGYTYRGKTYTDLCSYRAIDSSREMRTLLRDLARASAL